MANFAPALSWAYGQQQFDGSKVMPLQKAGNRFQLWMTSMLIVLLVVQFGCAQLRLPAIDPNGRGLFLPSRTTGILGAAPNTGAGINPLRPGQANTNPFYQPPSFPAPQRSNPFSPVQPAFQNPATPPPCDGSAVQNTSKKYLIPDPVGSKTPGQNGQIIMTPSRIVAPVGSEVVVLAGVCGGDGFFVKNQPLEWMLSNNSVGELVEVGGMHHKTFNRLIPPTAKKFSGSYAWGRTGMKNVVLSRGTPTPVDDIELQKGQTFASVSSASPGTSYVTAVAPKAEGWDRRRGSTVIHWVDGTWSVPTPSRATAGTVFPLTTVVNRTDGNGLKGWDVRYSIVGGAPAEFAPAGSQKADATTNSEGQATVQIRQPAGQFDPGTTQVRVDIVRPPLFGQPELVVESGVTTVTWSAPALTIRAIGPRQADADTPFNYRVEVTNPGDQVSRGVIVRTKSLDDAIEYISSTPKPTEYGRDYEWQLGDIPPGGQPRYIDVQLKSKKRGNIGMCFEVVSETDRLQTEACTETEISLPCIGFAVTGPTSARVGDDVPFSITVENQCDEPLENIQVTVAYDPGLVRPGKSNPSVFKYDRLQFGESKSLPISFNAVAPGTHCFVVEITGDNVRPQTDRRCIVVEQGFGDGGSGGPSTSPNPGTSPLIVDLGTPDSMEVGGTSTLTARVTNRGSVPLNNVTLINRFSASVDPVGLTNSINKDDYKFVGDDELWINIPRIEAGQTIPISIEYKGLQVDPDARTQVTVSTPSGANSGDAVGIQVRAPSGNNGGGPAGGNVPDFGGGPGSGQGGNGGIGIPNDSGMATTPPIQNRNDLDVQVRTLDQNVRMGGTSRIQISVTNNRNVSIKDVEVSFLIPTSINLIDFDSSQNQLPLNSNDDNTFFGITPALELRSGETLTWVALVEARLAGQATLQAQAKSVDIVGATTGSDSVMVSQ